MATGNAEDVIGRTRADAGEGKGGKVVAAGDVGDAGGAGVAAGNGGRMDAGGAGGAAGSAGGAAGSTGGAAGNAHGIRRRRGWPRRGNRERRTCGSWGPRPGCRRGG